MPSLISNLIPILILLLSIPLTTALPQPQARVITPAPVPTAISSDVSSPNFRPPKANTIFRGPRVGWRSRATPAPVNGKRHDGNDYDECVWITDPTGSAICVPGNSEDNSKRIRNKDDATETQHEGKRKRDGDESRIWWMIDGYMVHYSSDPNKDCIWVADPAGGAICVPNDSISSGDNGQKKNQEEPRSSGPTIERRDPLGVYFRKLEKWKAQQAARAAKEAATEAESEARTGCPFQYCQQIDQFLDIQI